MKRLQGVPGIGPVSAVALVVRLKSSDFASYDQFVAYVGLDVRVRQSGQRKGTLGLTKQGDAELRRLLYLCASASVTAKNSPLAEQYERELAKGLPRTAALNALARKLARLCWSMHRYRTSYDPARVHQPQLVSGGDCGCS